MDLQKKKKTEKKIHLTPLAIELHQKNGAQKRKDIINELYAYRTKSTNYLQKGVKSKEYAKIAKFIDAIDASISFLEEQIQTIH